MRKFPIIGLIFVLLGLCGFLFWQYAKSAKDRDLQTKLTGTLPKGTKINPVTGEWIATDAVKPAPLITHAYNVDIASFVSHLQHLAPPESGETRYELLLRYIKQQHIDLPENSSISWSDKDGKLFVMTTPAAQKTIHVVIQKIIDDK